MANFVDYRHLNAITVKNRYPLPIMDELLDELDESAWFSKLDLCNDYHKIRMLEGDEYKTTFWTHHGHWEFKVMPFGLTRAPGIFQETMNVVFAPLNRNGVLIFMDDILVYTATLAEHLKMLPEVFKVLIEHQFYVKQSKCSFAWPSLEYLGHIINAKGVATYLQNIAAIQQWPTPTSAKDVRSFLWLAGYYRKFITGYGSIGKPLIELLKKNFPFMWPSLVDTAF